MKNTVTLLLAVSLILFVVSCGTPEKHLFKITDSRGAIGFIDVDGKVVVEPQYQNAGEFVKGIALVRKGVSFGFIASDGKLVVPLRYPYAGSFSDGLAVVGSGHYIDAVDAGRYSYPPYTFQGKFGYIDTTGRLVIPHKFGLAKEFSEGLAVIGEGSLFYEFRKVRGCNPYTINRAGFKGKFGYIDTSGNVVIQAVFDEAHSFSNGLALVKLNGKYRYIDKKGKAVWNQ